MPLKKLYLSDLGPFGEIEFDFDDQVNVFTGANNSGKSTALMALGEIAVYPFSLPTKLLRPVSAKFSIELDQPGNTYEGTLPIDLSIEHQLLGCGALMSSIGYSSFVPAIRRSTDFRATTPTTTKRDGNHFEAHEEFHKREALIETEPTHVDDDAVVQKIIEIDYRAYRTGSPAIRKIVDNTVAIASQVTEGFPIRFARVDEDAEGLFPQFYTPDGVVPLNVLSQGTQSLIQWIAHLVIGLAEYYDYPSDFESRPGVLIVDEIDAHLHPSWQRRIIPTLTEHFPNLQIFCSTHSPLMLAGLRTGQVQLLDRDNEGKITVSRNEQDIIGWSADEILRSFLDVESPTDLETLNNIQRLQELRQLGELSATDAAEFERLRKTVHRDLVGGPLAAELEQLRHILNEAKTGLDPAQN